MKKVRDDKIRMMQGRQKEWMQQRQISKQSDSGMKQSQKGTLSSSAKPTSRYTKESPPSKAENSEVLLWTAKNPEAVHEGFVVRKQSARSEKGYDKMGSARSTSSKGTSLSSSRSSRMAQHDNRANIGNKIKTDDYDERHKHATSTPERRKDDARDFGINSITNDLSSIRIAASDQEMITESVKNSEYDRGKYSSYSDQSLNLDEKVRQSISTYNMQRETVDLAHKKEKHNIKYSTHCCPQCNKLMHLQSNLPYLIIPCGHNICAQCQPGLSSCPTCNAKVASTVENVTLSHVIKEYKKHEEKEELVRKEKEARKYVDEYDSLKTRCDVLSSKAEGAIEVMEEITSKLVETKTSMKALEGKRTDLVMRIENLKEELSHCEDIYNENQRTCDELERSYSKEKDNFDMIENTLERVKQSKERVKTLILSFIPTFVFDED